MTLSGRTLIEPEREKPKSIDRVTIGAEESARLADWLSQIGQGAAGFLDLTKLDVVNFLIRAHAPTLSPKELKAIRAKHYDPKTVEPSQSPDVSRSL